MTTPLIGSNVKVEMQKTLGSALTISAITKASPGVVTSAAHGLANGDVVKLSVAGMVELDSVAVRVANVATNTFELENVDTTNFSTFVSGTATKVTAWDTLGFATAVNLPNAAPTEIDVTTLIDITAQTVYGMPGAQSGSIDGLFQPNDVAMANLRTATRENTTRAFRVTWQGATGQKAIFNANVAAGQGFTQGVNAAATTSIAMTVRGFPTFYAS